MVFKKIIGKRIHFSNLKCYEYIMFTIQFLLLFFFYYKNLSNSVFPNKLSLENRKNDILLKFYFLNKINKK